MDEWNIWAMIIFAPMLTERMRSGTERKSVSFIRCPDIIGQVDAKQNVIQHFVYGIFYVSSWK